MAQNLNTCDQTIMKKSKFILLTCIVAISLAGCQEKEDPNGNSPNDPLGNSPEELLFKGYNLLNLSYTEFYEFASKNNGNAPAALYETGKLILDTGIPQDVYIVDSIYMYIVMNADITMLLRLDYVDENDKSIYRGGPDSGNRLMQLLNENSCSNAIPNNKVLLWGAADDLSIDYSTIKEILSASDFEFEVTELLREECTPSSLKTLDQYGLVLIDTHGMPDAILTGSKLNFREEIKTLNDFKKAMLASLSQDGFDDFLSGKLKIGWTVIKPELGGEEWWKQGKTIQTDQRLDIWADMDFLENLPDLSNTIIFNNSCYSGATVKKILHGNINGVPVNVILTETVANAFMGRNPIAYYGWNFDDLTAGPVDNYIATQAEENFISRLADSADSTGMAYRKPNGDLFIFDLLPLNNPRELRLSHFNKDSFCYQEPCEETFTDPRDGQVYKTVCIGDQVWMAENLRATKYNDNTPIATGHSNSLWSALTTGAYTIYPHSNINGLNSDAEVLEAYGALYNGYAVDASKGLCPLGWHVPTDEDWTELVEYVVAEVGEGAGNALKSCRQVNHPDGGDCAISEHPRWDSDAVHSGYDVFGFSALPGGYRNGTNGSYEMVGRFGLWWSASGSSNNTAYRRAMGSNFNSLTRTSWTKDWGLCVRCIKD